MLSSWFFLLKSFLAFSSKKIGSDVFLIVERVIGKSSAVHRCHGTDVRAVFASSWQRKRGGEKE